MSDSETVRRLLAGDPGATQEIRSWIRTAAAGYRRLLQAEDLEDLEQQALVDLLPTLATGKFRGESTLHTYVRSLVHHRCIDTLRGRERRRLVPLDGVDPIEPRPSPLDRLSSAARIRLAAQVLEAVPTSCRKLFELVRRGLSAREIGEQLGIAEGAVRARLFRCRRQALKVRDDLESGA